MARNFAVSNRFLTINLPRLAIAFTLQREVRFLKAYAFILTLAFIVDIASGFRLAGQKTRFDEIDVERINIVEKDGRLKLVKDRDHFGIGCDAASRISL